ncbi:porin, partial [Balneolaceae bacterium ANBcel3]|nr:porin [Balneolaceae bacterium ANBcel3]
MTKGILKKSVVAGLLIILGGIWTGVNAQPSGSQSSTQHSSDESATESGQHQTSQNTSFYRLMGFLQQQFIFNENNSVPHQFSIHRVRVGLQGRVTEQVHITLVGGYTEPPDDTPRLVNAFADYHLHPMLSIRAGQFLVPFGLEGQEIIALNPAIERSTVVRRMNTFMMFSDVGVQVGGRLSNFEYAFALVNGAGANRAEQIDPKDLVGRVGIRFNDRLNVGFSGHIGRYQPDPASTKYESRYRGGVDVDFSASGFFFRGEYLYRQDDRPDNDAIKRHGGYGLAGYALSERLDVIARYEYMDQNTRLNRQNLSIVTLGANVSPFEKTRISANYEFREDDLNPGMKN